MTTSKAVKKGKITDKITDKMIVDWLNSGHVTITREVKGTAVTRYVYEDLRDYVRSQLKGKR